MVVAAEAAVLCETRGGVERLVHAFDECCWCHLTFLNPQM